MMKLLQLVRVLMDILFNICRCVKSQTNLGPQLKILLKLCSSNTAVSTVFTCSL